MITVFTPTYNRKENLKALYSSLLNQRENFEWVIVDDGSQDDTKEYVETLIKENKINIQYCYKENGGKPSAFNKGLELAKGQIFLCIDSDDILENNILSIIKEDFKEILDNNKICAIMYNQGHIKNKTLFGKIFPEDNLVENYYNVYQNINLVGSIITYTIIFMVIVRRDGRGLHDYVANTKVVLDNTTTLERKRAKEEHILDLEAKEIKKDIKK